MAEERTAMIPGPSSKPWTPRATRHRKLSALIDRHHQHGEKVAAQDHRFEADPIASVRENFVACDVLSQLQRVMENPRFLLGGECVPLRAGDRVRVYASRGPYACIYPHDTIAPCKWTHKKALSK